MRRRWRGGWTLIEAAVAVTVIGILAALALYSYGIYRDRAHSRLCHAQQRTLQKQIDSLGRIDLDVPMEQVFGLLIANGLVPGSLAADGRTVQSVRLNDPGRGEGSWNEYYLMPGSRMVGCRKHRSAFLDPP